MTTEKFALVTVGIPTYARGERVFETIEKLIDCSPSPKEIIVHIDQSDGILEKRLNARFPHVITLSSTIRVGPGGGRHRCLMASTQPIFASFDDDSWPIDQDYFEKIEKIFLENPNVACLAASIYHRNEKVPERERTQQQVVEYTGCGHAMRVGFYREISGYVDRPTAYGLEERDVTLQLLSAGYRIIQSKSLRVYHDTALSHHGSSEITCGTIENAALLPWLRYPVCLWPYGFLQYGNVLYYLLKMRRFRGMWQGIINSPKIIWKHRHQRRPLLWAAILTYLQQRNRPERKGKAA